MAIKKLTKEDLTYGYAYTYSTKDVEPAELFPGQERVKSAFDLALSTESKGYNLYVSGLDGMHRVCGI